MKKTIIGIIIGLLVGIGAVGAYLHFSNPKDEPKNNKEENKTENKEEVKKDEYYQFYFENGKIYYSLNKGEKKYLMDIVYKDKYKQYPYDNYLYDDDKLYYYTYETKYEGENPINHIYYFYNIDLQTKKVTETPEVMEVDTSKSIYIRKINDGKVYYAYGIRDYTKPLTNDTIIKIGIDEYSLKDKKFSNVIEKDSNFLKGSGSGYSPPYITIYNGVMYIQITDKTETSIYKLENGKEEIIYKNIMSRQPLKVLNNKLYFSDNNLYSYDIDTRLITNESTKTSMINGSVLLFSDMIAYADTFGTIRVKTADNDKFISLKIDNYLCGNNNFSTFRRITDNKLLVSGLSCSVELDLNNVTDIPANEGGGSVANIAEIVNYETDLGGYLEFRK